MGVVMQIVQLTTFGVNYVGHPFNSGLSENAGMLRSLRYSGCFLALLVSEAVPPLNERWGWGIMQGVGCLLRSRLCWCLLQQLVLLLVPARADSATVSQLLHEWGQQQGGTNAGL